MAHNIHVKELIPSRMERRERDMLEMITQPIAESEQGNTAQHRQDMEAYQAYKRKDRVARILLFSSMKNDIMMRLRGTV